MKKILVILFIGIFVMGLAVAVNNSVQAQQKTKAQTGKYVGENGKEIQIQEKENNRVKLKVGNHSAECNCNLTQEKVQNKTKLYVKLSNGKNAEIKVMPDTASETALARLRLKVCSEENNCTIELKEVGKGEQAELAYEVKRERQSKVFGLLNKKMQVQAQIDAENGEVIKTKKPWWAFLASESEEKIEE